jgi:hypothetical protein
MQPSGPADTVNSPELDMHPCRHVMGEAAAQRPWCIARIATTLAHLRSQRRPCSVEECAPPPIMGCGDEQNDAHVAMGEASVRAADCFVEGESKATTAYLLAWGPPNFASMLCLMIRGSIPDTRTLAICCLFVAAVSPTVGGCSWTLEHGAAIFSYIQRTECTYSAGYLLS